MAIVKVLRPRRNRSKGSRASQAATRAGEYYTWGREYQRAMGLEQSPSGMQTQRGEWYGPGGEQTWDDVRDWAREQALAHEYTFKVVLSVKGGAQPDAAAWQRVMAGQNVFEDWRIVAHDDTAYSHAHVLFFGDRAYGQKHDKILPAQAFREWFGGLRLALERIEREQEMERQREREMEEVGKERQISRRQIEM